VRNFRGQRPITSMLFEPTPVEFRTDIGMGGFCTLKTLVQYRTANLLKRKETKYVRAANLSNTEKGKIKGNGTDSNISIKTGC